MFKKIRFFLFIFLIFCFIFSYSYLKADNSEVENTSIESKDWIRVETNSNAANVFENGNKPKFEMTQNGEFIYDAGQVLNASAYRGYYYKNVSIDGDFKLSFKINSDTKFTDSNMAYFCLNTEKEGAYIKAGGRDSNSFCFYDHSGNSFFSSLYGAGKGGTGFPHLAIKYFNVQRDDYYDVVNEVPDYNIYAYKSTANVDYNVVMERKGDIVVASIYNEQNQLVYHWKSKVDQDIQFKYLTLAIGNSDDGDGYGSSGPMGKIWDIKLEEEPTTPITPEPEDNLIYESLLPLLNKYTLTYDNGLNSYVINSIVELQKYSQEVKSHSGIIKVGSMVEAKKQGEKKEPVISVEKIKFIKTTDSPTVYQVDEKNKKIKKFLNEESYKNALDIPSNSEVDWSIVQPVSVAEFNIYNNYQKEGVFENGVSVSDEIKELYNNGQKLIKSNDNNTVYFITEDLKKRPIVSAKVFEELGFKWQDIKEVDDSSLNIVVEEEAIINVEDLEK